MRPATRRVVLAMPLLAAALAVVLAAPQLRELLREPGASLLVDVLRVATWALPALVALSATHFRQARLVLAAVVVGHAAYLDARLGPRLNEDAAGAILVGAVLSLVLVAWRRERGVLTLPGLASLALLGAFLAGETWLVTRQPALVERGIEALGPMGMPTPHVGLPWLATALLIAGLIALWRRRGPDGEIVGTVFTACLLAAAGGLLAGPDAPPALRGEAVPLAAWLAAGVTLAGGLHLIAWRHGHVDDLTGLPGRRSLEQALDRLRGAYSIAVVDVDRFKRFNDRHGHQAGDDVLRLVASELAAVRRGTAHRQGGEEFAILLPGVELDDAVARMDALRETIAGRTFRVRSRDRDGGSSSRGLQVTVSIGVAERSDRNPKPRAVLEAADQALLRAKRRGRNRVEAERRRMSDRQRRRARR